MEEFFWVSNSLFFSKLKYSLLSSQQIFVSYRLFSYTIILTLVFQEKKRKSRGGGQSFLSYTVLHEFGSCFLRAFLFTVA